MGIFKKLGKVGLGGIAGIVANKGMLPKHSGIGMIQRDLGMGKKRREEEAMAKAGGMRGRPMIEDIMMAEQVPAMKKGGKISAAQAVHKHERAKHKGQPLTKMAKGGSTASKRADGCAVKGKTKGRFV
jgi:hypothetical protein